MKLLAEAAKDVALTKLQVKHYEKVMSNGQVFKKWTRDEKPSLTDIVFAFAYETTRPRIRGEIFRRLVQLYNVRMAEQNWVSANEVLKRKVA